MHKMKMLYKKQNTFFYKKLLLVTMIVFFLIGMDRNSFLYGKIRVIEAAAIGNTSAAITKKVSCTCKKECSFYKIEKTCDLCSKDYKKCSYQNPKVKIIITAPKGWRTDTAKVVVSAKDILKTGNFIIQSIQAKIGENGTWIEITEENSLEITENCNVYVMVTDQNGITYEKSRYIFCFDREKPTINAAISNGCLSIDAKDTDSGIKAIYINGYSFTNLTNGKLLVRLQKFDAGYEYFHIQAIDEAGNLSETYSIVNPYYQNPESKEEEKIIDSLPENAEPTSPVSAFATITEDFFTDSTGTILNSFKEDGSKKNTSKKKKSDISNVADIKEAAREFYTIETKSGKVFYLMIEKEKEAENKVYFLTEVSENDLLNVTEKESETLPKNSVALESTLPIEKEEEIRKDNQKEETIEKEKQEKKVEKQNKQKKTKKSSMGIYFIVGVVGLAAILFYWKGYYKKKEAFDEEILEEEEIEEEEENEENSFLSEEKEIMEEESE